MSEKNMDPSDENPEVGTGANAERNRRKKELAKQKKLEKQEAQKTADALNASVLEQVGKYSNSVEPLFEVKPIIGKGLGLVARRFISKGTEILREDATLKTRREIICKDISLMNLQHDKRARFMELQSQCSCNETPCLETTLQRLFEPNCFDFYAENDLEEPTNKYLYLISARINHDCMPNAAGAYTDEAYAVAQAIQDIHPGEEITRDYSNLNGTTEVRRAILQQHYKFVCGCKACASNTTITDAQAKAKFTILEKPRSTTTLLHQATPEEIRKVKEIDQWYEAREIDFAILQRAIEGTMRAQAAKGVTEDECTDTLKSLLGGFKKNLGENNDFGLSEDAIDIQANIITKGVLDKLMMRFAKLKAQLSID